MVLQGIIQSCDKARAQQRKAVLLGQRGASPDATPLPSTEPGTLAEQQSEGE